VKGDRTLVGEAKHSSSIQHECARVARRPVPPEARDREIVRALFVPRVAKGTPAAIDGVHVVTLDDLF